MATESRAGALTIDRLGPSDLVEVFGFLDRDPVLNVYLLALVLRDALAQPRDEYWGARRDGVLLGVLHLGGQTGAVLPLGDDSEATGRLGALARERLASLPRRFQVIGPRASLVPFLERFSHPGPAPRLERSQVYLAVDGPGMTRIDRVAELAPARREDQSLVYESGALLRTEELDEDPRRADPLGYRRRVDEECRDGHTYLWKDAAGLRFRASVSALTADAAQVSGVYVPPDRRGQGFGYRGLGELCLRLLERSRVVCLFVNDFNLPALKLYRRLGFAERAAWMSAFYDTGR